MTQLKKRAGLHIEQLEERCVPAVSLSNGLLRVDVAGRIPTGAFAHEVSIFTNPSGDISITEDGSTSTFDDVLVQALEVHGDPVRPNVIQNNTGLPAYLEGGDKADRIFTGTGSDLVNAGRGDDLIYSLLGTHIINPGSGKDLIYSNPRNTELVDNQDKVVEFFASGRIPGSGLVQLVDGVIYITPPNNGSSTVITQSRKLITVDTSFGRYIFSAKGVTDVAYFGGSGNDFYLNLTNLREAVYGSAGRDTLVSGTGKQALLKGSGDNDILVGRADTVDISGNGGADWIYIISPKQNRDPGVVRVDAADLVFGLMRGDLVTGP